jgi:transposase
MEVWLLEPRARQSNSSSVTQPIDYMPSRWDRLACFIDEGRDPPNKQCGGARAARLCPWTQRVAVTVMLIMAAKLNDVDPQAWLADVLARIAGTQQRRSPGK